MRIALRMQSIELHSWPFVRWANVQCRRNRAHRGGKHLWFYVARVGIFSRYIQESPFLGSCDELSTTPVPMTFEARHQHM
jgi:hypothetical protein